MWGEGNRGSHICIGLGLGAFAAFLSTVVLIAFTGKKNTPDVPGPGNVG